MKHMAKRRKRVEKPKKANGELLKK